ncbi:MAG: SPFH domain-containing protein [Candidatus Hydrogenedentes bacterium]|nr:SPFH domain-containing protein [Candidatus Hydrogenedentota bacterium]
MDFNVYIGLMVVLAAILFFSFIVLLTKRYKRCPSNCVLVIYGKVGGGISAKCIPGGAAFVWPLIQDYSFLSLEPIQIEVPLRDALSSENIRVSVPSVFTVAIGTEPELMQNAAIRLLGLDTAHVKKQAEDIIFGQLRQVIASMQIEDINRNREQFLHNIQNSLEPELRKIGLVLINVNITDITDESGYIEAIGKKAASQAVQQARGDVAEQEKLGEIRVAEAERDKLVQVANATKFRNIGIREAQREQAVRVAELEKEEKVGQQNAAFQREAQIKESERIMRISVADANSKAVAGEKDAERSMRVAVADANAQAITGENTAQAQIAASQAGLQVKQAEAYQLGETRKRESEAAVLEAQNRAMAKAAMAEAERVEMERRAALEAPAKAEKAKIVVDAEAEADKRRIEALGEASAIFAKLEAEAKGNYEILAKKADGLRQIIQACGGSQQAFQMLMLEHMDNLAQTAATAISQIKFDKVIVWENGTSNGSSQTANFLQSLARTLPPMLQVMRDIGGVEVPEYLAKLTPDMKDGREIPASGPTVPTSKEPKLS